tara:strand:+ start:1151 stop:1669 length:519 start_codon:yes stop_codon:yes gene_type:complete
MKTKSFISNIFSISLIILFISCSNDDSSFDGNPETQQSLVKADAALIALGKNTLRDSLSLDLVIPENDYGLSNTEPLLLFPFYKSAEAESKTWLPVPNVQIEKNLKTYYSRSNGLTLVLHAEKFDSSMPYGNNLKFKELNIIAVRPSKISGLTRNELDVRDYNQMIDYLDLK